MFSKEDIQYIESKGLVVERVEEQLHIFKKGVPCIDLNRPATVGDGIIKLSDEEISGYEKAFQHVDKGSVIKFVPASGAATRMFKSLYEYLAANMNSEGEMIKEVDEVVRNISRFAFYGELSAALKKDGFDIEKLLKQNEYYNIVEYILESGLNYGALPKGLLKFHLYDDGPRTAFEEHLVEAVSYGADLQGNVRLHFTVSPEHLDHFKTLFLQVKGFYESRYRVTYDISFSIQKPSTDTIAVDTGNQPFRDENNQLIFRPGGHGALIENLDELDNDIIFIKNIDNIVPEKLQPVTYTYKKVLFMLLYTLQEKVYGFQEEYENMGVSEDLISRVKAFHLKYLHKDISDLLQNNKEDVVQVKKLLFLPIRVAGVVINKGEPGGGPFWVNREDGECTLQIVETSQVNKGNKQQLEILNSSTHFNPVDIVCGVKDYKGRKYDLSRYVNPDTGFISQKSKDGRVLKALELPGLWNGAMAGWMTIFVEVPEQTFNPVKTINDLLRPSHQQ